MRPYLSRKFILALLFTLAGCVGLFITDKISGSEFVTLAGIVLGAFTAGDAALNYIHRDKKPEAPKNDSAS